MNNKPPAPTSTPKSPQERTQERYLPGDPIPVPDAMESKRECELGSLPQQAKD